MSPTSTGAGIVDPARVARIVASAALETTRVLCIQSRAHPKILLSPTFDATSRFGAAAIDVAKAAASTTVTFVVHFVTESNEQIEGQSLLLIDVQRLLTYSGIPRDATAPELQAFAGTTALFNAWPFLRADVHALSVQLGLNPVLLPLLRMAPAGGPQGKVPATSRIKRTSRR